MSYAFDTLAIHAGLDVERQQREYRNQQQLPHLVWFPRFTCPGIDMHTLTE